MFAFLNVKANSKEIYLEIYFPSLFFQKNADVSSFVQIYGQLSRKKYARLLLFFFVESNSRCKDLLFPRGPNLASLRTGSQRASEV